MLDNEDSKTKSDILVEFLEIAFHSILFYRNIYPKAIFCIKKKYQIPIHVSRYPEVNEYITECLKTAKYLLEQNSVKQISLVIVTQDEIPLEKYCFDVGNPDNSNHDHYFVETEETFRQYLLKLSVADVHLKELPDDCSFQIQITTKEECSVRLNEDANQAHFPWLEAEKCDEVEKNFSILPVKTLDTSILKLNMYVEK